MYIIPQLAKCPKCGTESEVSPQMHFSVPTIEGMPVCPKCWEKFLKAYDIPVMQYTGDRKKIVLGQNDTWDCVCD